MLSQGPIPPVADCWPPWASQLSFPLPPVFWLLLLAVAVDGAPFKPIGPTAPILNWASIR